MSTEENKKVARRFTEESWNHGNLDAVDECCAPSYQLRATGGIAELKQEMVAMRRSFPDMSFTIEEMIAEGDAVVSRWTWRGTHLGELDGLAPTGKTLVSTGITIFHFADGKIVDDLFEAGSPDMRQMLLGS